MGSNNILQWNPTQANQDTDSIYAADPARTGGAIVDTPFDSATGNKLFFQVTTFCAALAQMLANAGATISDASISSLITQFQSWIALLASPAFTGTPTAPTPSNGDRTTKLATMANFSQSDTIATNLAAFIAGFGVNLAIPGHFKTPDGWYVQWGEGATTTGNGDTITFDIPFPNGILAITISEGAAAGWGSPPQPTIFGSGSPTASNFKLYACRGLTGGGYAYQASLTYRYIAIGY